MQYNSLPDKDRYLLYSFIALLIWLPIPLGSNREITWAIAQIWIALQTVGIFVLYRKQLPLHRLAHYKVLLWGILLFQVWIALQIIPLPLSLLSWLSPRSAEIYQMVDAQYGYISLDKHITTIALAKGVAYSLFIFNAIMIISTSSRLKLACIALVCSGTFQALYGTLMVLLKTDFSPFWGIPVEDIATGSFIYKNHYANYLLMVLCIGIGLVITQLHTSESGIWKVRLDRMLSSIFSQKMMIRLCLIFMVIALVMSGSRMGNAAFFTVIVLAGVLSLVIYKRRPRALIALFVSIFIIDMIIVGALFGVTNVQHKIMNTSWLEESRDQVLLWSLNIIKDFPLTGTGMSSFYTVFPGYAQDYLGFYDHAHNDYIQFAAEAGVPATIMLGVVVLYSLLKCVQTVHLRHSRTMKGIALGTIMAILGMLIHSTTDFNFQPTANALTFIFILFLANATAVIPAKTWVRDSERPTGNLDARY